MEAIIDTRLQARIKFHNVLHGFRVGRGPGTVTMELNIAQYLSIVDQYPLFFVFLNLSKAYNTEYCGRLISTLEVYGAVPHMCKLLATFWSHQEVITRHNGYHVPKIMATWRTTQGGLVLPTLFNMVVNNVVQTWPTMTVKYQAVSHEGLCLNLGRCLEVFCADNVIIGAWDSEWIQNALNILSGLFRRYGIIVDSKNNYVPTRSTTVGHVGRGGGS